jgi:hypothetical protein
VAVFSEQVVQRSGTKNAIALIREKEKEKGRVPIRAGCMGARNDVNVWGGCSREGSLSDVLRASVEYIVVA